jgi:hypothetical protein
MCSLLQYIMNKFTRVICIYLYNIIKLYNHILFLRTGLVAYIDINQSYLYQSFHLILKVYE